MSYVTLQELNILRQKYFYRYRAMQCYIGMLARYSWNSTEPTPTLGMRLLCNFVNVYTIAYRVQYTFTRYTRASLTDIGVGIGVRVGVGVGPVEFQLMPSQCLCLSQP